MIKYSKKALIFIYILSIEILQIFPISKATENNLNLTLINRLRNFEEKINELLPSLLEKINYLEEKLIRNESEINKLKEKNEEINNKNIVNFEEIQTTLKYRKLAENVEKKEVKKVAEQKKKKEEPKKIEVKQPVKKTNIFVFDKKMYDEILETILGMKKNIAINQKNTEKISNEIKMIKLKEIPQISKNIIDLKKEFELNRKKVENNLNELSLSYSELSKKFDENYKNDNQLKSFITTRSTSSKERISSNKNDIEVLKEQMIANSLFSFISLGLIAIIGFFILISWAIKKKNNLPTNLFEMKTETNIK